MAVPLFDQLCDVIFCSLRNRSNMMTGSKRTLIHMAMDS